MANLIDANIIHAANDISAAQGVGAGRAREAVVLPERRPYHFKRCDLAMVHDGVQARIEENLAEGEA
jgi:hypothetical protein